MVGGIASMADMAVDVRFGTTAVDAGLTGQPAEGG
jgi:hypothetical protein